MEKLPMSSGSRGFSALRTPVLALLFLAAAGVAIAGGNGGGEQGPPPPPAGGGAEQQGGPPPPGGDLRDAAQVVGHVLELTPDQGNAWKDILKAHGDQLRPIRDQIRQKEQDLRALINASAPDAAAIGQLVLAIKALRGQIDAIETDATTAFIAILTEEQKAKIAEIAAAAPLCHVVPAFARLNLI